MHQKWGLWMVLALFGVFLVTSSNARGESWNRAVFNRSSKPVVINVVADMGNVWFTGACTTENGPCTIPPGQTANTKYTTTQGITKGTFHIVHGTAAECTYAYWGATPHYAPAVRFSTSTCPGNITQIPGWDGYLEIRD